MRTARRTLMTKRRAVLQPVRTLSHVIQVVVQSGTNQSNWLGAAGGQSNFTFNGLKAVTAVNTSNPYKVAPPKVDAFAERERACHGQLAASTEQRATCCAACRPLHDSMCVMHTRTWLSTTTPVRWKSEPTERPASMLLLRREVCPRRSRWQCRRRPTLATVQRTAS